LRKATHCSMGLMDGCTQERVACSTSLSLVVLSLQPSLQQSRHPTQSFRAVCLGVMWMRSKHQVLEHPYSRSRRPTEPSKWLQAATTACSKCGTSAVCSKLGVSQRQHHLSCIYPKDESELSVSSIVDRVKV
jgi:hypothetical protein